MVSGFINFPLNSKIPKLPLQKGRADVAALTTGGDRILYVKVSFSREKLDGTLICPRPETKTNENMSRRHSH